MSTGPRSLSFRLMALSSVLIVAAMAATGVLLLLVFRTHIERRLDMQLHDHLEELAAAAEIGKNGQLALSWTPSDPRFNRPLSGWYWQIAKGAHVLVRSKSLLDLDLPVKAPGADNPATLERLTWPDNTRLRVVTQDITLPESEAAFTFAVTGPASDIDRDMTQFRYEITFTLSFLSLALLALVFAQIVFGLHPLKDLRRALAAIRAGEAERLPETAPEEVLPVVRELNALLENSATRLERARTEAGNLAHALKNPLSVIANEASEMPGPRGEILRDQSRRLAAVLERYLKRARMAGRGAAPGQRVSVSAVLEDLKFSLGLVHKARGVRIDLDIAEALAFPGDAHDLEELLGNLMDNACKWARHRVRVEAERVDGQARITIEDDGPGIPPERRKEALQRGRRLDEAAPGSGIGLAVASEIAETYGGSLMLEDSALGGLKVICILPAAV